MDRYIATRDAFGEALVEIGRRNPKVVVFDADVCTSTKTSLFREVFPERFFQMGVAEQNMMCAAAGCSTVEGLIPWVSTFAVFAAKRALDQVSISIAYPRLNVKINGSYAGIPTGRAGATHQSVQDIANMRAMPNIAVIAPVDGVEVRAAVSASTEYEGPVYMRTTRHKSRVILDPDTYRFRWGRAVQLREGHDLTLIGTGVMSILALDSALTLEKKGIHARVLHIHTVKPLDEKAVLEAAAETRRIITVENHSIIGGLGGAVCEVVTKYMPVPVRRIGFPDVFGESGDNDAVFRKMGLSVDNVVRTAMEMVSP